MRELKFRVWVKEKNKYEDFKLFAIDEYGDLYLINNDDTWLDKQPERDKFIVEQYTGLKDKNGKEIYEGDLFMDDGECYTIKQPSGNVGLYLCHVDDDFGDDLNHSYFDKMEVIGNIHENPELLGKGEE